MTTTAGRLRACWTQGQTAFGLWLSTDGTSSAEALARTGFDYLVIDLQHGLIDSTGALNIMRSLARTDATVLCRVPSNDSATIGQVLDAGADGVIIPMVNDVDATRRAVAACRYAPDGTRSFGPTRARLTGLSLDTAEVNSNIVCIPMIETTEAVANVAAIAAVPGVDALYLGPSDLSLTLGLAPAGHHNDSTFTESLDAVLAAAAASDIVAGIHANPDLAARRAREGFKMVTATTDLDALTRGADAALRRTTDPP